MADTAEIGVFGGSGFYSLLDDVREVKVDTPYGAPSDSIFLADVAGPPGRVPAAPRAAPHDPAAPDQLPRQRLGDAVARRQGGDLAVRRRLAAARASSPATSSCATSSSTAPSGRADTFYDGPIVTHLSSAETYDPVLRQLAIETIRDHGIEVHERGTVVVIQGPRFSTKSESKWFSDAGWEVINMTQYPEAWLCRELGIAVVNISLITDYDAGVHEGTEAVDATDVLEVFQAERGAHPEGRARPDRAVPGRPRRARGARRAGPDPRRRPRDRRPRTSASSRRGSERDGAPRTATGCRSGSACGRSAPSPAGGSRAPDGSTRPATRASGAGTTSWAGRPDRPGRRGAGRSCPWRRPRTPRITVGAVRARTS